MYMYEAHAYMRNAKHGSASTPPRPPPASRDETCENFRRDLFGRCCRTGCWCGRTQKDSSPAGWLAGWPFLRRPRAAHATLTSKEEAAYRSCRVVGVWFTTVDVLFVFFVFFHKTASRLHLQPVKKKVVPGGDVTVVLCLLFLKP